MRKKHVTHKKKMGSVKGEEKKKKEHTSHNTIPCKQFCLVKRMIRGFRVETTLTYSQTLNRQTAHYLSINVVSVCFFFACVALLFSFSSPVTLIFVFHLFFFFRAHLHTVAMIFGRVIFQVHESVVGTKKKKRGKKKKRERKSFLFLSFFFFPLLFFVCSLWKKVGDLQAVQKKEGRREKKCKNRHTAHSSSEEKKKKKKRESTKQTNGQVFSGPLLVSRTGDVG